MEIHETEARKSIEKMNKAQNWSFEMINKIDKTLARKMKEKSKTIQIIELRNKRRDTNTDLTKIKRIIRKYLEKVMAPHSSTLAWKIPWTEEPGRLQFMGSLIHFHFSLLCIGEGNGNPLQCSCLENPRDGGAWCAAVYGVAQSRT